MSNSTSLTERIDEVRAITQAEETLKALGRCANEARLDRTRDARKAAWATLVSIAEARFQELDRAVPRRRTRAAKATSVPIAHEPEQATQATAAAS